MGTTMVGWMTWTTESPPLADFDPEARAQARVFSLSSSAMGDKLAKEIEIVTPKELASRAQSLNQGLAAFLDMLDLPTEGVLVPVKERRQVIDNMEAAIEPLPAARKSECLYISKFIAAASAGLFDAALNYLWDETIRNLRDKVARFDLAYFFDTVLSDPVVRPKYKDVADLEKLDDWQLVKGCRETGIITDIGFRHLDYIRDMRNYASAAHPNHNELSGLQLVAWLQTCIKEVLGVEPAGPVVEVRRLLNSLRKETLTKADVPAIEAALEDFPPDLAKSLMRSLVGMYCDPALSATTRSNIKLIALAAWKATHEDGRYETGLKHATLSANGEATKAKLAREFLDLVDGITYLPTELLAVEIGTAVDALAAAHGGFNNFHNEPAPARILLGMIPKTGAVPRSVRPKLVKTITMSRIGNGYGVSWAAVDSYDQIIALWSNDAARAFVRLLEDAEVTSRLRLGSCSERFQKIAEGLEEQVTSPALKKVLQAIVAADKKIVPNLGRDTKFRAMLATLRP
jgi:hypothetical protein